VRPARRRPSSANFLGRTVLWFIGLAAAACVWSLVLVVARGRVGGGLTGPGASPDAPPALEPLGRFPPTPVVYDPAVPGRLHSGGELSEDGGRTWRPLVGGDGRRIVSLGGARALAPALGPEGRVLYGEVLFDEPSVPRGLGAIAHAAEWRGDGWNALLPVDLSERAAPDEPRWRVNAVAYLRGRPALAVENELLLPSGDTLDTPVRVTALLADSSGAVWVATDDPGRFPLYVDPHGTGSWQPVAGAFPASALAEGGGGVSAAGKSLGRRGADGSWLWTGLPNTPFGGLAAHPRQSFVAVWGPGWLWISRDAASRPKRVPLGDLEVAWAAWDPARDDALTLLDRGGFARRLSMASVR
jgi:hypothetical protein